MSRLRSVGAGVLVIAVVLGAAACSKDDDKKAAKSDRPPISFSDAPKGSTTLGLCYAYDLKQMKDLIGGTNTFKQLPPAAIGAANDKVQGEACGWTREEPNGDAANLRIEVRNFGKDTAALQTQFDGLKGSSPTAEALPGIGDEAFGTTTDDSTVMQVRSGPYLMTLSSRAEGSLEPVTVNGLTLLAASGLAQLP